jgi:hypothetical protein
MLLTSLTLGRNYRDDWTVEEDETVVDLIQEYKTWGPCLDAKDKWSSLLSARTMKAIKSRFTRLKRWG